MSTEQYAVGEKVRVVEAAYAEEYHGRTGTLEGVAEADEFRGVPHPFAVRFADGDLIRAARIERVEPASEGFVVGQKVSGDDYVRLPVGSVVLEEPTEDDSVPSVPIAKTSEYEWTNQGWPGVFISADLADTVRTLTRLGDGIADVEIVEPVTEPSVDNSEDLTEPELKKGDWVQVWAEFVDGPDEDGDVRVRIRSYDDSPMAGYARSDAIIRPADGATPPWVKPAQCPSLKDMSDSVRIQCAKDANVLVHLHRAVYAGVEVRWPDDEAYGRVEVSS